MFQALLIYHPFVDGMKRTGIFSCIAFLLRNGYLFISKDVEDSIQFAISVADKSKEEDPDSSIDTISNWIAERMISFSDKEKMREHAHKSQGTLTCPICRNDMVTLFSPKCRDCGNQLKTFTFEVNAIVEKANFQFKFDREIDAPAQQLVHKTLLR